MGECAAGRSAFAERVRDAMLVAGVESTEDLVRRCAAAGKLRLTAETIARVLTDPENCIFRDVADLCAVMRVRPVWLVRGRGIMQTPETRDQVESLALAILSRLTPEKAKAWIALGRANAVLPPE